MAAVLGPKLDLFLREISRDLRGKTHLEEPYVDKRTIIHAVREQNNVILMLQERILRMGEVEKCMKKTIDLLQEKVTYFEAYTKKVDRIEDVLSEKIPLLDKINEVVQDHDVGIEGISFKLKEQTNILSTFKSETQNAILQTKDRLEKMGTTIDKMPETISISTQQVKHHVYDGIENLSDNPNEDSLADIITEQEQRACVQDRNIDRITDEINKNVATQDEKNMKMEEKIKFLIAWKKEQNDVDLVTLKDNQSLMKKAIDSHENELSIKMSKDEVDTKLQSQFKQLVDHLQMALTSVESDEADFKSITDSLSMVCESLREKKADKSEIVCLRKQFIDNQINAGYEGASSTPLGGCTLDNEDIRRILCGYPTTEKVENMIKTKLQQEDTIAPRFERIDATIQNMQQFLEKVLSIMTSEDVTSRRKMIEESYKSSLISSTGITQQGIPNNYSYEKRGVREFKDSKEMDVAAIISKGENLNVEATNTTNIQHEASTPCKSNDDVASSLGSKVRRPFPINPREEERSPRFPSSNVMHMQLSEFCDTDESDEQDNLPFKATALSGTFLSRSVRPKTAPDSIKKKQNLKKKHSLPAIFTTIRKTVRAKHNVASSRVHTHKGSFQVVPKFPRNRDRRSIPSDQIHTAHVQFSGIKNLNTKMKENSKKESIVIRTSIE